MKSDELPPDKTIVFAFQTFPNQERFESNEQFQLNDHLKNGVFNFIETRIPRLIVLFSPEWYYYNFTYFTFEEV